MPAADNVEEPQRRRDGLLDELASLATTRAQIAEHERFRDFSRRFVEAGEEPCRARLKAGRDAARTTA